MKLKNNNFIAVLAIIILVLIYTIPLLLNFHKAAKLYPKNKTQCYGAYTERLYWRTSVIDNHQLPLWLPNHEGGVYWFAFPHTLMTNPANVLLIFFNEIEAEKIIWISFYIIGALSMFFLCRYVLKYDIFGAIFASIVFSMSGYFASEQHSGFFTARSTLLLPLLFGLLFRAQCNKKYIIYSSIILALISLDSGLYISVIVLFMFIIALLFSFNFSDRFILFNGTFLKRSFYVCILAFLFSSVKNISTLSSFELNIRLSGITYEHSLDSFNNFRFLYERLLLPREHSPGMFVGYIPLLLCIFSALIYFKRMKVFIISLVLAIWFSFGPNAIFDLHRLLWHLPVYHEIIEIEKYYGLFIIFFIAIIGGRFFLLFYRFKKRNLANILSLSLITCVFLNLTWANIAYFNDFDTQLPISKERNKTFFNVKYLNVHEGDESITEPLMYFFSQNNMGSLNQGGVIRKKSAVIPKYFLLPRYGLLMPYTSLLALPNPLYKGEAFFLRSGSKVGILKFSANELIIDAKIVEPDILIINHNYDKGWKASIGKIENHDNLLAVRFDKPINCKLRLKYCPGIFLIGLAISLFTLIVSAIYVIKTGNNKRSCLH